MDDLEALLAESIAAKSKRLEPEPGDPIGEIVRKYKESIQYLPVAVVALFRREICSCGAKHCTSIGIFLAGEHKSSRSRRLIPTSNVGYEYLPRVVEYHDNAVNMCISCVSSCGFGDSK